MEIWLTGLESGYELEHLARLFFPGARLLTQCPARAGQDLVRAGKSKKSLFAAVRSLLSGKAAPPAGNGQGRGIPLLSAVV